MNIKISVFIATSLKNNLSGIRDVENKFKELMK
jgi:hypothetical protein